MYRTIYTSRLTHARSSRNRVYVRSRSASPVRRHQSNLLIRNLRWQRILQRSQPLRTELLASLANLLQPLPRNPLRPKLHFPALHHLRNHRHNARQLLVPAPAQSLPTFFPAPAIAASPAPATSPPSCSPPRALLLRTASTPPISPRHTSPLSFRQIPSHSSIVPPSSVGPGTTHPSSCHSSRCTQASQVPSPSCSSTPANALAIPDRRPLPLRRPQTP